MNVAVTARIGLLGLGAMGRPMAATILRNGFPLSVYDVRPEARAALVAQGAHPAESVSASAERADAYIVMVQNFDQARAALWGDDATPGALDALTSGALVILMSTVAPADARALAAACAERHLRFLDAPVSGGPGAAELGTLSIMLGGPTETVAAAQPILHALGDPAKIRHIGQRPGDGQAMKMINQLMAGVNIAASCEALVLAAKLGLDPKVAHEIVSDSAGQSWMFRDRVPRMLDGTFSPPKSALNIFMKDMGIVTDAADELGLTLFLASVAHQVFKMGADAGLGSDDDSGLVRIYERFAGVTVGPRVAEDAT